MKIDVCNDRALTTSWTLRIRARRWEFYLWFRPFWRPRITILRGDDVA